MTAQPSDQNKQAFLYALFNRFHGLSFNDALKSLPKEKAYEILQEKNSCDDPSKAFSDPLNVLAAIHYSWLAPLIKSKHLEYQKTLVASLANDQKTALSKYLNLPLDEENPSYPLKKYIAYQTFIELGLPKLRPLAFLPSSPFNKLLHLSKAEMVELIDLLGLYDLAEEIRNIVDTKNLKNIYSCLTGKKQQFLRICLHQKEKVSFPKLQLEKWDGNCSELHKLLHKRGIIRLGKALSGQNENFIWYLIHFLDIGRGTLLEKEIEKQEIPTVSQALSQQVLNVFNFLEKGAS